jgi:hypothetical protein
MSYSLFVHLIIMTQIFVFGLVAEALFKMRTCFRSCETANFHLVAAKSHTHIQTQQGHI